MATRNMRTVQTDLFHYEKTFKVFKEQSREHDIYEKWSSLFLEAVASKLKHNSEDGELRILGIGSGSGEVDCTMLRELLPKHPKIINRVVEPSDHMLIKYRNLVKTKEESLSGVVFDWRQQTFEDYHRDCQKVGDDTKFHFIHVIHTLYYVEDADTTLAYLYEKLENGGVMLVNITSDKSGIHQVHQRFPDLLEKDGEKNFINYVTTEEVRQAYDKRDIKYTIYPQPVSVDVGKCYEEGNEDSDLLLDFLTHVINFKKVAAKELVQEYLQFLEKPECSKICDEAVMLNMDWDAITATRIGTES